MVTQLWTAALVRSAALRVPGVCREFCHVRDTDRIHARVWDFLNIITPGPQGRTLIFSESDSLRGSLMLMKMDRETERERGRECKARRDERMWGCLSSSRLQVRM